MIIQQVAVCGLIGLLQAAGTELPLPWTDPVTLAHPDQYLELTPCSLISGHKAKALQHLNVISSRYRAQHLALSITVTLSVEESFRNKTEACQNIEMNRVDLPRRSPGGEKVCGERQHHNMWSCALCLAIHVHCQPLRTN